MLDYLITNATVFDGRDISPQNLAVGIKEQKIAYVGSSLNTNSATKIIDAKGLYLCPGFIDTHASTGFGYTLPHAGDNKLYQGVTTEVIGNCGTSSAPIGRLLEPHIHELSQQIGFKWNWQTLKEWFQQIEQYGLPFNIGSFVGHSTLRGGICEEKRLLYPQEMLWVKEQLEQSCQAGALGLSTGLVYAPGCFADTKEIIDLAKIVVDYGGIYVSHIRDERQHLEESIEEAIEIGKNTGIQILVSHLKAAEKCNWNKIPKVIHRIEQAIAEKINITFEVYPYTAVSTKLRTFIPKDTLSDGVAAMVEKIKQQSWQTRCIDWLGNRGTDYQAMTMITESIPGATGKSIAELASQKKCSGAQIILDILIADAEAWIVYHCISEQDMNAAILWNDSIICSDSWSYPVNAKNAIGNPHPRTYGAFTRFIEKYALNGKIPFGHAIRKITSYPARVLGLTNRGVICKGNFADLTLLDPQKVAEKATFENPRQFSEGTEYVWVNGTLMLENGQLYHNKKPGHILKNVKRQ